MKNNSKISLGNIFVISAPSGAGKSSLVNAACARDKTLQLSISHTTRVKRQGEVTGVNYFFVSKAEFEQMIAANEFLEYANVYGNYYGTNVKTIQQFLQRQQDIILEIDYQGAMQVKRIFPKAILIFIAPPSIAELELRLRTRNTDSEEVIQARLTCANHDLSHQDEFDYIVINDNFNTALDKLCSIILLNRNIIK